MRTTMGQLTGGPNPIKKTFSAEFRYAKKITMKFLVKNFGKAKTFIILCCKFFNRFSTCKPLSELYAFMVISLQLHSHISREINMIASPRDLF